MAKRIYFNGNVVSNIGPDEVDDLPEGVTLVTEGTIVVDDDVEVAIGMLWNGDEENPKFTAPEPVAPPVPKVISPRQLKLTLLGMGLLDQVEAFVAQAAEENRAVQIAWEYTTEYMRNDALLNQMAQAFGLDDEQVDNIFRAAATL